MNAVGTLLSEPWVERLGWTLVHFLWQGLAIAMLYAAARGWMTSPNSRYVLACVALLAMMAAPVTTWTLMAPAGAGPDPAYRVRNSPPAATEATVRGEAGYLATAEQAIQPERWLSWVVMVWMAGAALFWVRLAGGWVVAARMRSMLVRRAAEDWQELLRELGARIGLTRPVRLLVSALVQVPTVVGWIRPVVLVPVGALGGLPAEHLEALLLHELAHIRRHDYVVNILQSIAEALLFYHPAVWWVSGHIRTERELCCDDMAVLVSGDALTYARALAQLESCRPAHLDPALAANGGSLSDRIARLLGQSQPAAGVGLGPGVIAVAVLLLMAVSGLFGQSDPHPAFQAASIKQDTDPNPRLRAIRPQPGGRFTTVSAPLAMIILNAYSVQPFQIIGGPEWIHNDGYNIEAKPEGREDRKTMWLMVQTLLADRFKLALHRETREFPVYALTAVKSGTKLSPSKADPCVVPGPDEPGPTPLVGGMPCGSISVSMAPTGIQFVGKRVPMKELVRILSMVLGRPVLDRTGFTSDFDINMSFTPDENCMGLPGAGRQGPASAAPLPSDPNLPNILAATEEQLGLKLSTAKGPVEVLVIDHVERPSAN